MTRRPPMHLLSSVLRTPGGITGIAVEVLDGYAEVEAFYQPWAEAFGCATVEAFLRSKNLAHPIVPTKTEQYFYLIYVATRFEFPFLVGECDARIVTPGNGARPPIVWTIPEPEEPAVDLVPLAGSVGSDTVVEITSSKVLVAEVIHDEPPAP